jgi:hypothetical protein
LSFQINLELFLGAQITAFLFGTRTQDCGWIATAHVCFPFLSRRGRAYQQAKPCRTSSLRTNLNAPWKVRTIAPLGCSSLELNGRWLNPLCGVLNKQILQQSFAPAATAIAWSKNDNPFFSAGISQHFSYNVLTHLACVARCCRPGTTAFQACSVPGLLFSGFGITSKIECM